MRVLAALGLGLFLAGAGCNSGTTCADKGGICTQSGMCPAGTEAPTMAELEAAGTQSTAYDCAASGAVDSGQDLPICCLKIPASN